MTSSGRIAILLCAACIGCDATVVSLGDTRPPLYHFFGTPRLISELDPAYTNENPTLTGDLLELWFNSARAVTEGDVWMARRDSTMTPFAPPVRVDAVSSPLHETSPAISADGLTLYFASTRTGGLGDLDIWRASRATRMSPWSEPVDVLGINSPARDLPRPTGQHDRVMPLSSQRDDTLNYQTFLSARPAPGDVFDTPLAIPELTFPGRTTVDAFLSDDGLTLFYSSAPTGEKLDLFVAWRKTTAQPFSVAVPLDDLNSADDERDPWLSPDGSVFFFTSDRSGALQIYEVAASRGAGAGL